MTSPEQVAEATEQVVGQTAFTAKQEAERTATTTRSAVADVAATATDQAGQVAGEAVNQLRLLADEARSQVMDQADTATSKLSERVRSLAGEVRDLSQGTGDASSAAAGLARQVADKGEELAEYLAAQGPGGLVQGVRSFAARRPGAFLLGALVAGAATGRIVKGATAERSATSPRAGQADVVVVPVVAPSAVRTPDAPSSGDGAATTEPPYEPGTGLR